MKNLKSILALLVLTVFSVNLWGTDLNVNYDFTQSNTYPSGFPTSSSTEREATQTISSSEGYEIIITSTNATKPYRGSKTSGSTTTYYLMFGKCTQSTPVTIDLPAIGGFKLTGVSVGGTADGSTNVYMTIRDADNEIISGGTSTQYKQSNSVSWTLSNTTANTAYKIYFLGNDDNSRNVQVASISLTYVSSGPTTYSVTYDANGATSGSVPTDETAYTSGATVSVKGNTGNLAKTGYNFIGWNTDKNAATAQYVAGNTFTISANTTLYAIWSQIQYTDYITECTAPGTCATPTISGAEYFITSTDVTLACTTEGATIYYSTDNGASYSEYGEPITITETTTFKAYATAPDLEQSEEAEKTFTKAELTSIGVKNNPTTLKYKVGETFDPTGLVITLNYEGSLTQDVAYNDETKNDFTFSPDLTTELTTAMTSVTISYKGTEVSDKPAITVAQMYTVTWYANGTQFGVVDKYEEGETVKLPTAKPDAPATCAEKEFVGWVSSESVNPDETPTYIAEHKMGTADEKFYAVFATPKTGAQAFIRYEAVTTAPTDWSGKYIMVVDGKIVELRTAQTTASMKAETVFSTTTEVAGKEVVVAKTTSGYSIFLKENNKYLSKSTNTSNTSTAMESSFVESRSEWILTTTSIQSVSSSRYLMLNDGSVGAMSSTTTTGKYVTLYKRIEEDPYEDYVTTCSSVYRPEFNQEEGAYYKNQGFSFKESASPIYYTTDGTDPQNSETKIYYNNSTFKLNATTTINARATDGNNWSAMVSRTFTINPTYSSIPAIQSAVTTTEQDATIEITDWLITAIYGSTESKTFAYAVNSENKGVFIYAQGGHGLLPGDKISGTINGSIKNDAGAPRVNGVKKTQLTTVTPDQPLTPAVIEDFSTIDASNFGALVTLKEAEASVNGDVVTLSDGTTSLTFFDKFGVNQTFLNGGTYTVTGIVMVYNTTLEIAPRTASDIDWEHEVLADPKNLAVVDGSVGTTKVQLSWDAVENVSSYTVTYTTGATVKKQENITTNSVQLTGLTPTSSYTWSVQAIGDGVDYTNSQDVAAEEVFTTLSPEDVPHNVYFHAPAGTISGTGITEQDDKIYIVVNDGATFTFPALDLECTYNFVGWTNDKDFAAGTSKPTTLKTTGATSGNVGDEENWYAVYSTTDDATISFTEFANDANITSAPFVIAGKKDNNYYAIKSVDISGNGAPSQQAITVTDGKVSASDLENTTLTISKVASTTSYNIKLNTKYLAAYQSNGDWKSDLQSIASGTDNKAKWNISAETSKGGTHRVQSAAVTSRALIYRNSGSTNKFNNYATSNLNGTEYMDVIIFPVSKEVTTYTLIPDCREKRDLELVSSKGIEFRLEESTTHAFSVTTTISAKEGTGSEGDITLNYVGDKSGSISIDGTDVTITATGTYYIKASQAATASYAAVESDITLTVIKPMLTITYDGNGATIGVPEPKQIEQDVPFNLASGDNMVNGTNGFVSWNSQADGNGTNYTAGQQYHFSQSTTLYAQWQAAQTITIATMEHGTVVAAPAYALPGKKVTLTPQPEEGYSLVPGSLIVTRDDNQAELYVNGNNEFEMPNEAVDVTVNAKFAVGALYTVAWQAAQGDVEAHAYWKESGAVPEGSSSEFSHTNTLNSGNKEQITKDNTMTLTLHGYTGKMITGITIKMKSNQSSGAGKFSATIGGKEAFVQLAEATNFNQWFDNESYGTSYRQVHVTLPTIYNYVGENEDVVFKIIGTTSSLYCESFFIEYVDGYRRDMSNGYMGTHCYPFDIAAGDYRGAQFYEIAYRIGDTRIYFDQVDHVEAGVPYLVVPEDEENGSILEAIVTNYTESDKPASTNPEDNNGFIGSYTQELLTASTNLYIVYNNEFRQVGNNVYVGKNRAYIDLNYVRDDDPQAGNPKAPHRISLRNSDAGTPTGINNIREEFGNPNGAMKVFHDGNIYFIRESKIYNAQGAELK